MQPLLFNFLVSSRRSYTTQCAPVLSLTWHDVGYIYYFHIIFVHMKNGTTPTQRSGRTLSFILWWVYFLLVLVVLNVVE
jgi:hypothetical protein